MLLGGAKMAEKTVARVAVYGTLRKDMGNHAIMKDAGGKPMGGFWTPPSFTMWDLTWYPAITLEGEHSVYLEVYEVEDLHVLDTLEGYPDLYDRKRIPTPWGEAYLYFMETANVPSGAQPVPSGNWMTHVQEAEEGIYARDRVSSEVRGGIGTRNYLH